MPLHTGKLPNLEGILPSQLLKMLDENDLVKPLLAAVSFAAILGGIYLWTVPNSIMVPTLGNSLPSPICLT